MVTMRDFTRTGTVERETGVRAVSTVYILGRENESFLLTSIKTKIWWVRFAGFPAGAG
jgi:hypothetical protein